MASDASLGHFLPRACLTATEMAGCAGRASVFGLEWEAKLIVLNLRALERRRLSMAFDAVLHARRDRVARYMAIDARARRIASRHFRALMTLHAGLFGVLALELYLRILGMLCQPLPHHMPAQGLTGLVTNVTFLCQLGASKTMRVGVTALAFLRKAEVTDAARLQALHVALGACHLAVMLSQ